MKNLLDFLIKYNYWFLFLLLEGISFALLFRFNNYQGSVFFTSSNSLVGTVYNLKNSVTSYFQLKNINDNLVQENVELKLQLESYRRSLTDYIKDTTNFERIKQESLSEYNILKARVLNNSLIHADNYITIDKGEKHGVFSEMGVVDGKGVVGIVYLTSSHYSVVIPILNSKSNISCKIKRSDYLGFLVWDGGSSRYAMVKDMPRHSMFSLGDTVVTSGHSTVFPSGLPIGTIEDIKDSNDGLSYLLKVKLFTDFACLQDVRVVSRKNKDEQIRLEQQLIDKE